MSDKGFVHLHLHTQYSLLDGAISPAKLFDRCKALGMDTVAVTDHGNLFGAIEFYTKANVDQLQWGTSNRMIWHYDVARSQSTAFAIDVARRLHRMFPRRSTGSK